ncbi:Uncharacterised protein [Mycobacteroides abscessus subsp. abscessus]|nr:Uncharacterised protein [Mycobacteroides abscessus subsp. abscessus]
MLSASERISMVAVEPLPTVCTETGSVPRVLW